MIYLTIISAMHGLWPVELADGLTGCGEMAGGVCLELQHEKVNCNYRDRLKE